MPETEASFADKQFAVLEDPSKAAQISSMDIRRVIEERVKKGIAWLDKHAPSGWRLQLFGVSFCVEGCTPSIRPMFNFSIEPEHILVLVFADTPAIKNRPGPTTSRSIAEHFSLKESDLIELGLREIVSKKETSHSFLNVCVTEEALSAYRNSLETVWHRLALREGVMGGPRGSYHLSRLVPRPEIPKKRRALW